MLDLHYCEWLDHCWQARVVTNQKCVMAGLVPAITQRESNRMYGTIFRIS